jgi:serine/threonine protein kinase
MTPAADVYAFGIILYEIFSRQDPYHGEDPVLVLRDIVDPIVDKRPPVPSTMQSCVSTLMQECLAREPTARPTFDEIAGRINRFKPEDTDPATGEKNFDLLLKVCRASPLSSVNVCEASSICSP